MGFGVSEVWTGKRSADARWMIGGKGKRRKKDLFSVWDTYCEIHDIWRA
jgi:hypothetical protein